MSDNRSPVHVAPLGPRSITALKDAIADAKGGDPMAPVTVLVPSNYSGLSMRRALGQRAGLLNVRFMVANRLAELIAGGRFPGKQGPLTPPLRSEAIRAALSADPGPFADAVGHASTERALEATFRDLRLLDEAQLDQIAAGPPRAAHLVRLYRDFRDRTAGYYDIEDLHEAATSVIDAFPGALRDIGQVVLYLPREQSPGELAMLRAIHNRGHLSLVAGLSGEQDIDATVHELAESLFGSALSKVESPAVEADTSILAAADADEEVRSVIRLISAEIEKPEGDAVRLHRIAVLYPSADPYAATCAELFAAAGIPVNGRGDRTLAHAMAGRTILGLLSVAATDFSRDAVMEFLALPVRLEGDRSAPSRRWEVLAREAGVTRGLSTWRLRLTAHARKLRADAGRLRDDNERLADRLLGDATRCDELLACVEALAADAGPANFKGWADYASHFVALLDQYLPESVVKDDAEANARRDVRAAVEELRGLDAMGAQCSPDAFVRTVEQQLRAPWGRIGSFDDGVFLAPLSSARGTDFDLVFILGMVEGAMPHVPREDPLLPDHERATVPSLRNRSSARVIRDREDFLSACNAGSKRVLCFPAADLRSQRKNLPSRWLLEVCSALAGRRVFTADFEALIEHPAGAAWFTSVPSLQSAISGDLSSGSEVEHDLRTLVAADGAIEAQPLVTATPALRDGLDLIRRRSGREFTEWDGNVGPGPTLGIHTGAATSPTRLESWATCGFRYFLSHVLRVEPTPEPEDDLRISPLEKGSLVHAILEEFFKEYGPAKRPGDNWSAAERAALRTRAETACKEAERAGIVGRPLLWRIERQQLLHELDLLLTLDEARRAENGATFVEAELAFGAGDVPVVEIPVEDGALRFRGKIDRVDRCDDGSIIVYDYKTGSDYNFKDLGDDPLGRGKRLQLPVYALAARRHFGAEQVRAAYWFVRDGIADNPRELPFGEDPSELVRPILEQVAGGIAEGVFPVYPGERTRWGFENCGFCDYDRLCAVNRGQLWRRKIESPALAAYVKLVTGASSVDDLDGGEGRT